MGKNHVIKIIPKGDTIDADHNPFPGAGQAEVSLRPGDTVTWVLPADREMTVVFDQSRDLPVNGNALKASDPKGPFELLSIEKGRIVGTVRADLPEGPAGQRQRFYYELLEQGRKVLWIKKPIEHLDNDPALLRGGGIDVPKKPPGGGGGG